MVASPGGILPGAPPRLHGRRRWSVIRAAWQWIGTGHLLVLWALAAAGFALYRIPYDDEWFSLTLATQTDWGHFWRSLADDCHPPWTALLDRALFAASGSTHAIFLTRVLAVAGGLALLRRSVAATLAIDSRILALAAWHPIVFYYAGAARWYPFVFLASALRLSALRA